MRHRYNAAAASSGAASAPVMQEACRAALQFAARFNAFALSGGALAGLTRAWQAAVEVAFTKRWAKGSALPSLSGGPRVVGCRAAPTRLWIDGVQPHSQGDEDMTR